MPIYRDIPLDTHRFDPKDEWMCGTEPCVNCGKPWVTAQVDMVRLEPDPCDPTENHPPFYPTPKPLAAYGRAMRWICERVERMMS